MSFCRLAPLLVLLVSSVELFVCWSLLESSDEEALFLVELLPFIESQRFTLRLEVARDGMKRSEHPKSDGIFLDVPSREGVLLLLPWLLLNELSSLVNGKKCFRGDICRGLDARCGESVFIVGVIIGVGRKIEVSLPRVIPGGGNIFPDDALDVDEGPWLLADDVVNICGGRASLLAYWRSRRDLAGDGKGTRIEREDSSDL